MYVQIPWIKLLLKGRGDNPFSLYEENEKQWPSSVGKWGFIWLSIKEQAVKTTEYSENEAVEIARRKAIENLQKQMQTSINLSDSHMDILSSPSDPIVRVKVFVESIEDIGLAKPIKEGNISH